MPFLPFVRGFSLAAGAALLAVAPAGCREQAAPPPAAAPLKTVADHFPIRVGGEIVQMQIAITPGEEQRGLMERGKLGPNEGMIFVDRAPHQLTYWMHDCPTPLDIGYFAPDGQLAEIYPLLPFDERTVASQRRDLQFALEMNQGWYSAHGVRPGDRVDLQALAAAVRARGFDPKDYGL